MKILIDAKFIELYNGGISSVIQDILPFLKKKKKIKIITVKFSNIKYFLNSFLNFVFLIVSRKFKIFLYDNFLFNLAAKKIKPDIVLSFYHDLRLSKNFWGKNFICVHDLCMYDNYRRNLKNFLSDIYYRYTLTRSLKYKPKKIITLSKNSANEIKYKLNIKNNIFIWNTPVSNIFWKKKIKKNKKKNILFYSGGWHPRKGIDLLLDSIGEYNKKYGKLEFRYTSYNKLSKQYQKKINTLSKHNKIINLGNISLEKLYLEYINCNCAIYPTTGEGFGKVVIESILTNTPLIIYNLNVFREIIIGGENLLIAKNRNKEKWADLIYQGFNSKRKVNKKNFRLYKKYMPRLSAENLLTILKK